MSYRSYCVWAFIFLMLSTVATALSFGSLLTAVTARSDACLDCTASCAILPPLGSNFPCYEGQPKHANFCYNTVSTPFPLSRDHEIGSTIA
jgi:hypothetical protein